MKRFSEILLKDNMNKVVKNSPDVLASIEFNEESSLKSNDEMQETIQNDGAIDFETIIPNFSFTVPLEDIHSYEYGNVRSLLSKYAHSCKNIYL